MNKVILADFSWCYHRAYHVFKDFSWQVGDELIPTGGLYGVCNEFRRIYNKLKCPIIACTEPESNIERDQLDSEYKAGRVKPEGIYKCWDDTIRAIAMFDFVTVVTSNQPGEADDVIYSAALFQTSWLSCVQKE